MRESDPARKSIFDLFLDERTVGRPIRRWTDEVEREMKGMCVKGWKGINGRKLWRRPRSKLGCTTKARARHSHGGTEQNHGKP
jgi:hypothetical protein